MLGGNHLGIVIDPKIFWYMILLELSQIIQNKFDNYRNLFTASHTDTEISVYNDSNTILPINKIIKCLEDLIPMDIDLFFPEFSTKTPLYSISTKIAFCETVSPFYSYSMFMCGIPSYTILGSQLDWEILSNNFISLTDKLNIKSDKLNKQLLKLTNENTRNNLNTWKSMFSLEQCGSGSDVEVNGWIQTFYKNIPRVKYVINYSSHIALVNYTNLTTNTKYTMYSGLFETTIKDGTMIPEFAWLVKECK